MQKRSEDVSDDIWFGTYSIVHFCVAPACLHLLTCSTSANVGTACAFFRTVKCDNPDEDTVQPYTHPEVSDTRESRDGYAFGGGART